MKRIYGALPTLLSTINGDWEQYADIPFDNGKNKGIPKYGLKRNRKIKGWQKGGKR